MSVSYRIRDDLRIVQFELDGESDFDSWRAALTTALSRPGYRADFSFLVDLSLASVPSPACVRRAVTHLRARLPDLGGARWAVVVPSAASYGMMRMAQGLGGQEFGDTEIFHGVGDAEAWLAQEREKKLG